MSSKQHILTGDIGGTHARFGRFELTETPQLLTSYMFNTQEVQSFSELVSLIQDTDLFQYDTSLSGIVIAAAGPVREGTAHLTNIPWDINTLTIEKAFNLPCQIINDFKAQAAAWLSPCRDSALSVHEGTASPSHPTAVIGAGTGLGKALVLPSEPSHRSSACILPSEGGHLCFPIEAENDFAFFQFVRQQLGHTPVLDNIVSGQGLSLVHQFLTGEVLSPPKIAQRFSANDPTLELFSRYYGRVCREFVLDTLSLGGLVICGGVAGRNPQIVQHPSFLESFCASRAHKELLEKVPVHLMTAKYTGLWGAATWYSLS